MLKVATHYFRIDRTAWLACAGILVLLGLLAAYEVKFKPYLGMTEMLAGIVPMFAGIVWAVALFSREFESKSIVWALGQDFSPSKLFICRMISPLTSTVSFGLLVWGIVEVSQLRANGLGPHENMMSYSYIAGHGIYPTLATLVLVSVAALAGILFKKSIPSVAITFALGLVIGTTGASWLNPLLPVERSEVNQAGMDESFNLVPGNTISSTPLDSGKALLEFYPNTAFWTAQGFYALLWVVTALILLCLTHYFFKRSARNVA
ncbi:ABC transporter permease [Corynebacterium striatum]|uniref:ABC transporter permease n=1 Tax=Corynebacterium striatum TaxID=43770 RepID=UPI003B63DF13